MISVFKLAIHITATALSSFCWSHTELHFFARYAFSWHFQLLRNGHLFQEKIAFTATEDDYDSADDMFGHLPG